MEKIKRLYTIEIDGVNLGSYFSNVYFRTYIIFRILTNNLPKIRIYMTISLLNMSFLFYFCFVILIEKQIKKKGTKCMLIA